LPAKVAHLQTRLNHESMSVRR